MTKNKQESLETLVTLIALELSKHTETATAIIEILADDEITKLGHEVFGQSFSSQSLKDVSYSVNYWLKRDMRAVEVATLFAMRLKRNSGLSLAEKIHSLRATKPLVIRDIDEQAIAELYRRMTTATKKLVVATFV